MSNPQSYEVQGFFDPATYTVTFVVSDPKTKDAVIIDPVLDYDPKASTTSTRSLEKVAQFVTENQFRVRHILETHAHADHLSGSQYLAKKYRAKVGIGEKIVEVQKLFKHIFNLPGDFHTDGSQFDFLLKDGEVLQSGSIAIHTIHTPGHTPACVTFQIGDAIFTGDLLFMHDYGTGRCDFPAGSAKDMYRSIRKIYELPDETRMFVGHDYMPGQREPRWETTVGLSKAHNPQIKATTTEEEFVRLREARDKTLPAPQLLFQSVQVNIDAGYLPQFSENQIRYLKIPVNVFRGAEQSGIDDPSQAELSEENIPA